MALTISECGKHEKSIEIIRNPNSTPDGAVARVYPARDVFAGPARQHQNQNCLLHRLQLVSWSNPAIRNQVLRIYTNSAERNEFAEA